MSFSVAYPQLHPHPLEQPGTLNLGSTISPFSDLLSSVILEFLIVSDVLCEP